MDREGEKSPSRFYLPAERYNRGSKNYSTGKAHESKYIPFLLGIRMLSIDPQFLPEMQKRISSLKMSAAISHAKLVLSETTVKGALKMFETLDS